MLRAGMVDRRSTQIYVARRQQSGWCGLVLHHSPEGLLSMLSATLVKPKIRRAAEDTSIGLASRLASSLMSRVGLDAASEKGLAKTSRQCARNDLGAKSCSTCWGTRRDGSAWGYSPGSSSRLRLRPSTDCERIDSILVYCTVVFMTPLRMGLRQRHPSKRAARFRLGGRSSVDNFNVASDEGWSIFEAHPVGSPPDHRPLHMASILDHENELRTYFERARGLRDIHRVNENGAWASGVCHQVG